MYSYAAQNPVIYVDPDGNSWTKFIPKDKHQIKQWGKSIARGIKKLFKGKTNKQQDKKQGNQSDVPEAVEPKASPKPKQQVPDKAKDILEKIEKKNGAAPKGYKGGGNFENDGRANGEILPKKTTAGKDISYKEYDVNAYKKGVNRGGERIVKGDNGKSYFTKDHYKTFTEMTK